MQWMQLLVTFKALGQDGMQTRIIPRIPSTTMTRLVQQRICPIKAVLFVHELVFPPREMITISAMNYTVAQARQYKGQSDYDAADIHIR
jgi:hypothetical protein